MYDKGYSSLDVAIKLDISFQEAENYKIDYWKHRDMDEFEQIYRAKKDSLPLILSNLRELQTRNISLDRLSQVIHLVSIMPQLNSDYQRLSNEESMRIINNDKLNYGIFKMRYILKKLSFINWTLNISELKRLIT
jgi:cell division ATPase FtsA